MRLRLRVVAAPEGESADSTTSSTTTSTTGEIFIVRDLSDGLRLPLENAPSWWAVAVVQAVLLLAVVRHCYVRQNQGDGGGDQDEDAALDPISPSAGEDDGAAQEDFDNADHYRETLLQMGVELMDKEEQPMAPPP